ncbi:MAG: sec-independent protein translocase protein TatC [Myxococcota bacterium]|jgi:sec-independent protein translocase protein TatC
MPESDPAAKMPLGGHLDELRKRLGQSLLVIGALFLTGWVGFSGLLKELFMRPHLEAVTALAKHDPPVVIEPRLALHSPFEDVLYTLKVSLLSATLLAFPFLIWQLWRFISSGLYKNEKLAVLKYVPFSLCFAAVGIAFGYLFMIPTILEFLYAMPNPELVIQSYRLEYYFSVFMLFTISLSLIFQLPILMLGLGASGLVDAKFFSKYRRHFILVAFVIGAMLTPPEPYTQILMALPTIILFELGIVLMRFQKKNKA